MISSVRKKYNLLHIPRDYELSFIEFRNRNSCIPFHSILSAQCCMNISIIDCTRNKPSLIAILKQLLCHNVFQRWFQGTAATVARLFTKFDYAFKCNREGLIFRTYTAVVAGLSIPCSTTKVFSASLQIFKRLIEIY